MYRVPPEKQSNSAMQRLFGRIAPRYDLITRALSFGRDQCWKACAVARTPLPGGALVLDLACGTGDLARWVRRVSSQTRIVGADLSPAMLRRARSAGVEAVVCSDAMRLPFPDAAFDAVFVGYGLRNFPRLEEALLEIRRVLRPGGWLASLDFYLPEPAGRRAVYLAYLTAQGAFWGLLLHGRPSTYTYIPRSLRNFRTAAQLATLLVRLGYRDVSVRQFVLGGIALHWGTRI